MHENIALAGVPGSARTVWTRPHRRGHNRPVVFLLTGREPNGFRQAMPSTLTALLGRASAAPRTALIDRTQTISARAL
ncbi:MAG TPA: hypothetical protein VLN59_16210, partial [Burkholderiales bacterium]|nr:hypothetical protein [Burkholderiales bacterium]